MTISLYGLEYKKSIASVIGWRDCYLFVKANGNPTLLNLFQSGRTGDVNGVIKGIDEVLPKSTDLDVKSTLQGLKDALGNCRGWAVVSE